MTALLTRAPARNRAVVAVGLGFIVALAWAYLFLLSARMGHMKSPLAMPMTSAWGPYDVALMWTMWAVMMAGMMLPSAVPMVQAYSDTIRFERGAMTGSTPLFVVGYLLMWATFAGLATGAQWILHDAALVNAMGTSTNNLLGGVLLAGAGIYQFTNVKDACLGQCRSPIGFLLNNWSNGPRGALTMGIRHGTLCVGCCWALMALLFVLGVMNLWWVALVAAVVLLEKLVPGDVITRVLGSALIAWGGALIVGFGS